MARADSRTFLGFEGEFVAAVARTLLLEYGKSLAGLVIVVPGRRAGRKLLEALLLQANDAIEPPRIVTEAGLFQELSVHQWSLASQATVEWAWFDVLARANPAELAVFTPDSESASTFGVRISLARQLAALDRECAAEGLSSAAGSSAGVSSARLSTLATLSSRVRLNLETAGRLDPAHALERLRDPTSRRSGVQVLLAGVVEISPALRALLESLSPRSRALIQASDDCAGGFDDLGALIAEYWVQRRVPLRDEDWLAVEDSSAAVQQSIDWVSGLPDGTTTEALAIGVLGEALLPGLTHGFARLGQRLHSAAGESARESAPWSALDALHGWVLRGDFSALATALRHPDIETCVRNAQGSTDESATVAQLDAWHAEHLPDSLGGELPFADAGEFDLGAVRGALRSLCAELGHDGERALCAWTAPIVGLLCRLYPTLSTDVSDAALRTRSGLECFAELARDIGSLTANFWATPVRGEQALRLWLEWTGDQALRGVRTPGAIEALGWLELAMEEAPYLLLVGLNDGWVPQNQRANPLLGEVAASVHDERGRTRLARDVHALTAILLQRAGNPKQRGVRVFSLRQGTSEDPLRPSRLLFHAADAVALARARAFYPKATAAIDSTSITETAAQSAVAVMPMKSPQALPPVSISSFKTFLSSPYLYYLQNVLRLKRVRDDAWELDPLGFGSLVHEEVLKPFGNSKCKDSTDAKSVEGFLIAQLRATARLRFGEKPLPAVRLQLQQLERRLRAFAQKQVLEVQAGWRIDKVEFKLESAALDVDGDLVAIRGRVDRIDRHVDGRRWRILDYKTGDDGTKPRAAHVTKHGWLDLQLPLYRHFLREQLPGEIELGYFAIPRKLEACGVYKAEFEPAELDAALEEARRVLREMRAGRFAHANRARPTDRVQRALFGLSLLSLTDDAADDEDDLEVME